MFDSEREWAIAMLYEREFADLDGCRYKFFGDNDRPGSPFKILVHGEWESMQNSWSEYNKVFEVFKDQPNLDIGAKVLVTNNHRGEWKHAHFSSYGSNNTMICSKKSDNKEYQYQYHSLWRYWKVLEGKHKGKSNIKIG